MNKVILGDCIEEMDKLIAEGIVVDSIICDLPYGITACKWDSVIPFAPMWKRLNKLIKLNGAIVLFGSEPFSSALRMSNIKNYKYDWVWEKSIPSGMFSAKYQPMKNHENIIVFGNGKLKFYPIKEERSKNTHLITEKKRLYKSNSEHNNFIAQIGEQTEKRFPTTIKFFSNVSRHDSLHPTQKPIALMEYLIKTYTSVGETVLDFTIGSGTTAVAAINTGRNFIGIEKSPEYCEIAKKRIKDLIII